MKINPKQIILIRHAEKKNPDGTVEEVHLSANGYKRANEYVNYFTNLRPKHINKPNVIIAMKQKKDTSSNRPVETVQPVAKALKIPIYANWKQKNIVSAFDDINRYGKNKTVLVSWEHDYLVHIAQLLGAPVEDWGLDPISDDDDSDCYNAVWVITNDKKNKKIHFDIYKSFEVSEDGEIKYESDLENPTLSMQFKS
jgi:hypothetical protein